jgi:alkanesulfonate monooxygenase SsuD/methylene tetrahydromethanopterin reductase-like flavin-dependent oxidoreductase (luciferase family)
MNQVAVGVSLPQFTDDPRRLLDGVHRAEAAGLDSIWVFDHLWPFGGAKERPVFECWSTLAWLAAITNEIGIGTLVTRSSLRHPALLAKMAATVGAIAPGRLTVGIGSGDHLSRTENEAFDIPYWPGDERIDQLVSTVKVLRRYLNEPTATHRDDFVALDELPTSPHSQPPPRIWVGGRSEQVLEVAGTQADGWNGWGGTPEVFAADSQLVLDYAQDRPMELSWAGQVVFGETDRDAVEKLGPRNPKQFVVGAPETVAAKLLRFVEAGARHIVIGFPDAGTPGAYETLGETVLPILQTAATPAPRDVGP